MIFASKVTFTRLFTFLLLVLLPNQPVRHNVHMASGEAVFHKRFHEDQWILNPPQSVYKVTSEEEVINYLIRYGYLSCTYNQDITTEDPDVYLNDQNVTTQSPNNVENFDNSSTLAYEADVLNTTVLPDVVDLPGNNTEENTTIMVLDTTAADTSDTIAEGTTSMLTSPTNSTDDYDVTTSALPPNLEALNIFGGLVEQGISEAQASEEVPMDHQGCSKDDIELALKAFQKLHGLQETGVANLQTMEIMSERRCGNDDSQELAQLKNSQSIQAKGLKDLLMDEADLPVRKKRHSLNISEHSEKSQRKYSNRILDGILNTENSHKAVFSKKRRQKMMEELTKDAKETHHIWHATAEREKRRSKRMKRISRSTDTISRVKRSNLEIISSVVSSKCCVTWRYVKDYSSVFMEDATSRASISLAFRQWSEVSPLKFCEDNQRPINEVDIIVGFGKLKHMNCKYVFDGPGGEIGHVYGLQVHIDNDEPYVAASPTSQTTAESGGIILLHVLVHEIGHVVGLGHEARSGSVMNPVYSLSLSFNNELDRQDRNIIQEMYGMCTGTFDIIFDWVRPIPNTDNFIYNTYFTRDDIYWMYENGQNRPRYGDPSILQPNWSGLPENLDAYVQLMTQSASGSYVLETYFFKGDYVYKYNNTGPGSVLPNWPKRIGDVFPGVPNNLDGAYFGLYDGLELIYFFKGSMVFILNYKDVIDGVPGARVEVTASFGSMFKPSSYWRRLDYVTNVYYHVWHDRLYFFQGEYVWLARFHDDGSREVEYMGHWNTLWFDICDITCN